VDLDDAGLSENICDGRGGVRPVVGGRSRVDPAARVVCPDDLCSMTPIRWVGGMRRSWTACLGVCEYGADLAVRAGAAWQCRLIAEQDALLTRARIT
jgi:hypothetical protein